MKHLSLNARAALMLTASVVVCGLAPVASFANCPAKLQSTVSGVQDSGTAPQIAARGKVDSGTAPDDSTAPQVAARGKVDSGTAPDDSTAPQVAARGKVDSGTAPQLVALGPQDSRTEAQTADLACQ